MTSSSGPPARPALHRRLARVLSAAPGAPGAQLLSVEIEGDDVTNPGAAIAYTDLVGAAAPGDRALLNTTAVDLRLGSGGLHFVIALLDRDESGADPLPGHLMKLRYTPFQCAVAAAEDMEGCGRDAAEGAEDLGAAPVVACELHSQVPAVAAGYLARYPEDRVVYIMTPGGAMALPLSRLAPKLREAGLVHVMITAGQCFGGDLEAINLYSALLIARVALKADLVIVGQGPGNAGTGTRFGFSGIEQGEAANAAASLGGRPIVCLRASAADPRERHQTPSHHTLTVLDRIVRCRCTVPIARDAPGARRRAILEALRGLDLGQRHELVENERGALGLDLLAERGVEVTTMGRSISQDREFFLHASAAGAAAATMKDGRSLPGIAVRTPVTETFHDAKDH